MLMVRRFVTVRAIQSRRWSSTAQPKSSDRLRILFCGSDEFSCASLRALEDNRRSKSSLIESIDVVSRPPKPVGRGYKVLRHVPIQGLAEKLKLPFHAIDTFTGWSPPKDINLVIAVSFGLFVPPRILRGAKYGGLNVHPSILPDLRGAAPIQWAIMLGRERFGVTLQTLSETTFDGGKVLAQTPYPGFEPKDTSTYYAIRDKLAGRGAWMLVDGLTRGVHVPPRKDAGWKPDADQETALVHAPKIRKKDSQIRWGEWTAKMTSDRTRALGNKLWSHVLDPASGTPKRVIFDGVEEMSIDADLPQHADDIVAGGAFEGLRFVCWVTDVDEGNGHGETKMKRTVLPYFEDGRDSEDGKRAVLVPLGNNGGFLRIREMNWMRFGMEPAQKVLNRFSVDRANLRSLGQQPT